MRSFDAEDGGGRAAEGGRISRGTARPGIGRGSEVTIVLCTSAMTVVVAQNERVLFTGPEDEASSSFLHEIEIRAWRTLVRDRMLIESAVAFPIQPPGLCLSMAISQPSQPLKFKRLIP